MNMNVSYAKAGTIATSDEIFTLRGEHALAFDDLATRTGLLGWINRTPLTSDVGDGRAGVDYGVTVAKAVPPDRTTTQNECRNTQLCTLRARQRCALYLKKIGRSHQHTM